MHTVSFLLGLSLMSCFDDIFTSSQSLASKWSIEEPSHTFVDETNTFTITFAVDSSITQGNTGAIIYEKGCRDEGNELVDADGIVGLKTAVDTVGLATMTFDFDPKVLTDNSNIFTPFPDEARAEMQICALFMLQTDDGLIEVNYLETIITIFFDLTAGFEVEGISVAAKEQPDDIGPVGFSKSYGIDAYLCDPSYPETELTPSTFIQGSVISVCVTPAQEAIDDGLLMQSIDSFTWARGFIEQEAIGSSLVSPNALTSLSCTGLSLYCSFSSILYADFFTPPTCEERTQIVDTTLDFFQSTIKQGDIHLGGELRYGNIGSINGQEVDLLVTATDYLQTAYNGDGKDPSGNFGELSVKAQQGDPTAGEGTFEFCFVQPDTYTEVTASSFHWSVFDLDKRGNGLSIHEKLTVDTTQAHSFSVWPNKDETEIHQYCENDESSSPPCDEGVRTIFEATTYGTGKDNPTEPNALTDQQKKRSIVFTFKNRACWTVTFTVYCPFEPEQTCTKYNGGKLLFAGSSEEITQEGEVNCVPTSRKLGESEDVVRNLSFSEPAKVGGFGEGTLTFGPIRHLSEDRRSLQTTDGSKAEIELAVEVITSEDNIDSFRTAGGNIVMRSSTKVLNSVLILIVLLLL